MKQREVLAHVLEDHDALRGDLDRLEGSALRLQPGDRADRDIQSLRSDARTLLAKLRRHVQWEERHLLPSLRGAHAWGEERARRLIEDYREQRALLDFLLERLRDDGRPDELVCSDVFGLIAFLRLGMAHEESDLTSEGVLRDDVVGIEVKPG